MATPADIALYGGSAGGGKSFALLLEPLRHISNPDFGAVIFRRTFAQVALEGGLWDEACKLYPLLGARPNRSDLFWSFPSGARIKFAHMQYEQNMYDWQGAQVPLIEFDELTHFRGAMVWYMLSRNRSTSGVRPYVRMSCNPDADSWVTPLIEWWVNPDTGYPIPERSGVLRWFYRVDPGDIHWYDSPDAAMAAHPAQAAVAPPKSFTFISASIHDNQVLMKADPGYLANLMALPMVDRERLLSGNWKIRPAAGKVFNRGWFEIVKAVPASGEECRFWDFAGTAKTLASDDPDYTAGVKVRKVNGIYYVLDCVAVQEGPVETEKLFRNTAIQDRNQAATAGARYCVRFELEPGSAAIRDARRLVTLMDGFDVAPVRATGDKITRAKALASQAESGNVKLLQGAWNEEWLRHMHAQPAKHDDIMDATAAAYNELQGRVRTIRSFQG